MAIDIEICSTALVTIGASPISSFTDGSTEATACNTLYEPTVQNELASHPWRFASNEQTISRLSSTPIGKWSAAYQIPADLLSIRAVRSGDRVIPFDRFEDNVFCDAGENETLSIEGTWRVDEQFWPPYFRTLIEYKMASKLASALAERTDLAGQMDGMAMRQAATARHTDSKGRTTSKLRTSRLINRRFRNGHNNINADYE